jgi:hypothetical protein
MSSYVTAAPELVAAAATDVADIGSSLREANAAATAPTTAVAAAAEDEVSSAIASIFSGHGQAFQALSAQAAAFHAQFVRTLNAAGKAYSSAEAAGSGALQSTVSHATAAEPLNISVAFAGKTLIQMGSAHASSSAVSAAIAVGANSVAKVDSDYCLAAAIGANNAADATGNVRNVAVALGGTSNVASAAGIGNIAIVDGGTLNKAVATGDVNVAVVSRLSNASAIASQGSHQVVIKAPDPVNLSIRSGRETVVQLGSAQTSGDGGIAIAYGDHSTANSGSNFFQVAVAMGNNDHATVLAQRTNFGDTAVALGDGNSAVAGGINGFAGVLGGSGNSASALGDNSKALVLTGDHQDANATRDHQVVIKPSL